MTKFEETVSKELTEIKQMLSEIKQMLSDNPPPTNEGYRVVRVISNRAFIYQINLKRVNKKGFYGLLQVHPRKSYKKGDTIWVKDRKEQFDSTRAWYIRGTKTLYLKERDVEVV